MREPYQLGAISNAVYHQTMCYSAQIEQEYLSYTRVYGADISLSEYTQIYWVRQEIDPKIKLPRGMDMAFMRDTSGNPGVTEIQSMIRKFDEAQATKLQQEVFAQRKRLADAERTLQSKTTKAATESKRIAADKIERAMGRLADLRRDQSKARDDRIFPGWSAPVMIWENGRRVVKPMRYQCRPAGKPAFFDARFPGTYNARRDSLGGFWKDLFGYSHGVAIVSAFFENVSQHTMEHRELGAGEQEKNVILEFRPEPAHDMLVACLWSKWAEPGQPSLLSFAAITDEPPAEVAAAGHDRCIIPIKPENIDAWLNPDPENLAAQYAILDDRDRPYYEHRVAA
jgi:putative SOS response-associated peptidase YedK